MNNVVRVGTSTASEHGAISNSASEIDETKSWFSRRLSCLIVSGIAIIVITMICLVLLIILIARLNEANTRMQSSIHNAQTQMDQLVQRLQVPLNQLAPTLAKLNGLNFLQTPGMPTQTTGPDIPPIVPIIGENEKTSTSVHRTPQNNQYTWKGCENHGICEREGFSTPPLVILSLDGFAREYLEKRLVKSLEYLGECGARAERVFPSYPSKTFPNHYTIVTGLYPESHGITDNSVFDKNLSPILESMKTTKKQYFGGDPIWSAYKRQTGKRAHCLFWVGCPYNASGILPDVAPPYDGKLKFRDRIDMIIKWLNLPSAEKPGLITAYMDQPDSAGHYQDDVDGKLAELDADLDYFLSRLHEEKLLECINLVILSDHGMNVLNQTYYFDQYVPMDGLVGASGVVGRIYINSSDITPTELSDKFQCKIPSTKAYTRQTIPTRKHYSSNPRVGDVIIEGPAGTTFYPTAAKDYHLKADHGYDYLNPHMQTIFFARGPSIRQGVTVPAYQNVQYMNLWISLLGMREGSVPNNGTVGFFDEILVKSPERIDKMSPMSECRVYSGDSITTCAGNANPLEKLILETKLRTCPKTNIPIYSDSHCVKSYCQNSIIRSENDNSRAIVENLSKDDFITKANYSFIYSKYDSSCPVVDPHAISIAVRQNEEMSNMIDAMVQLPNNFLLKVMDALQSQTIEYLNRFDRIHVITGVAIDTNYDGVADNTNATSSPTHLYRIIVRCEQGWQSTNPPVCLDSQNMKTLAFIFPIVEKSPADCMDSKSILTDYMSTIFDIERLAGFEFQIPTISHHTNVIIRRRITTQLW